MSVTFTAAVGSAGNRDATQPIGLCYLCKSMNWCTEVLYFAHTFRHPTNCSYTYGVVQVSPALTELMVGIISIVLTNKHI